MATGIGGAGRDGGRRREAEPVELLRYVLCVSALLGRAATVSLSIRCVPAVCAWRHEILRFSCQFDDMPCDFFYRCSRLLNTAQEAVAVDFVVMCSRRSALSVLLFMM